MGGAILSGLRAAGVADLRVTTRTATRALEPADGLRVLVAEQDSDANRTAVRGARLVVIAVKPAGVTALLTEIADTLEPGAVVVSVAAGIPIATMAAALPAGTAVLRAMPNTPSAVGAGVTGIAAAPGTAPEDAAAVVAAFRTVGTVVELAEDRIDSLSAVSGSGPAYLYLFLERFTDAARRLGFSAEEADALVVGTAQGALRLLAETGDEPAELRRRVTSPKGTTERAVAVFEQRDLGGIFDEALAAAIARAAELAAG
ncbi:MAG: proC [Amnibacterium sp.]|nr:proC [Amnibacterium sp.]